MQCKVHKVTPDQEMYVGVPQHAPEEHKFIARLINDGMRSEELFRACFTFYQLELQERLKRSAGAELRVQSGLFEGMALYPQSLHSQLLPKWLGTYELEVQELLVRCGQQCDTFLDIGCAEGFYLTGMSRWKGIHCAGVDIDPRAKHAVEEAVQMNDLQGLVSFHDSIDKALQLLHGNLLILVDVDGNEHPVLTQLQARLEKKMDIKSCQLIIESDLDDHGEHNTSELIRFLCENNWRVIEIAKQQPHLRFTARFSDHSFLKQAAMAGEGRHGGQCWIHALWTGRQ